MTSKTPIRSAEDIDETALSYAEIKALAAGNPKIIEKTELDADVSKLKLLKQSFLGQIYEIQDKVIKYYPNEIKILENRISCLENDIKIAKQHTEKDKFNTMILKGMSYIDKQEAGIKILKLCKEMKSPNPIPIGNYRGFEMEMYFDTLNRSFNIILKNNMSYEVPLGSDTYGNLIRIDNAIDGIDKRLDITKNNYENIKVQFEHAKEECEKEFPQEEELQTKVKRLEQLNVELNINEKTPEILDGGDEPEIDSCRGKER